MRTRDNGNHNLIRSTSSPSVEEGILGLLRRARDTRPPRTVAAASADLVVPAIIAEAGEHATRRFLSSSPPPSATGTPGRNPAP